MTGRPAGEHVTLTEVRTRTPRHASIPRVAEVLADLGLLDDDTTPAIRQWIHRRASELPAGFAEAVRAWLLVLLDGDARTRPRSQPTRYVYFAVRPFIQRWSADRGHLREITIDDVDAALDPLHGHQRRNAINALRSLFRFAKKRPGLRQPHHPPCDHPHQPQPAADNRRRDPRGPTGRHQPGATADRRPGRGPRRPHRRHPAPPAGRPRPAQPAHQHRRAHPAARRADRPCPASLARAARHTAWPHTPNQHVLVSEKTALGVQPVSKGYFHFHFHLRRHGVNLDRIRKDRILHEVLTVGPDPRPLALVFNLSHTTASRYATIAEDLLDDQSEQPADR